MSFSVTFFLKEGQRDLTAFIMSSIWAHDKELAGFVNEQESTSETVVFSGVGYRGKIRYIDNPLASPGWGADFVKAHPVLLPEGKKEVLGHRAYGVIDVEVDHDAMVEASSFVTRLVATCQPMAVLWSGSRALVKGDVFVKLAQFSFEQNRLPLMLWVQFDVSQDERTGLVRSTSLGLGAYLGYEVRTPARSSSSLMAAILDACTFLDWVIVSKADFKPGDTLGVSDTDQSMIIEHIGEVNGMPLLGIETLEGKEPFASSLSSGVSLSKDEGVSRDGIEESSKEVLTIGIENDPEFLPISGSPVSTEESFTVAQLDEGSSQEVEQEEVYDEGRGLRSVVLWSLAGVICALGLLFVLFLGGERGQDSISHNDIASVIAGSVRLEAGSGIAVLPGLKRFSIEKNVSEQVPFSAGLRYVASDGGIQVYLDETQSVYGEGDLVSFSQVNGQWIWQAPHGQVLVQTLFKEEGFDVAYAPNSIKKAIFVPLFGLGLCVSLLGLATVFRRRFKRSWL